jgi:flavin-dependent dehydrogenase
MTDVLDVLVVGGGPVGLACAIEARRLDLSVAVVEARAGPVDKACGEGLMPSTLAALTSLGVEVPGRPFVGIRYLGAGRQVDARFRAGPGRGVRRTSLHAALADRAEAVGVEQVVGTVREIDLDGDRVTAAGRSARWLVGADGLHSVVRRRLGVEQAASGSVRFGQRRHFALAPWTDHVEVYWGTAAEVYVTPVSDELVGVAVLAGPRLTYDEALSGFPDLQARLRGADAVTDVRGAGPLRQRASTVRSGRALLVGDAAGYVDALTGEGLGAGFASARLAARSIAAGRPEDYPAAWARGTRRSRLLTRALLGLTSREQPRRLLVPLAAGTPGVFVCMVNLLA